MNRVTQPFLSARIADLSKEIWFFLLVLLKSQFLSTERLSSHSMYHLSPSPSLISLSLSPQSTEYNPNSPGFGLKLFSLVSGEMERLDISNLLMIHLISERIVIPFFFD